MSDDAVAQGSQPLDRQLDHVAGLEPAAAASGVSSRMQPVPTVPEPSTSPGRSVASRLAWASNCGQVQYIEPELPRDNKRPLTAAVISRWNRPSR